MNLLELLCRVESEINKNEVYSFNDAMFILNRDKYELSNDDKLVVENMIISNTNNFVMEEKKMKNMLKVVIKKIGDSYEKIKKNKV